MMEISKPTLYSYVGKLKKDIKINLNRFYAFKC